jgi:hypothetical protein
MRKLPLAAMGLALAMLWSSTSASAQAPTRDSVTGTAEALIPIPNAPPNAFAVDFNFNASSGPSGEDPTGTVTMFPLDGGPVTCLNVNGIDAVVGIAAPTTTFGGFLIYVSDNGTQGAGVDTLELVPASSPPQVCPTPVPPNKAIFTGDITVIDAPSLPTSKEHCKKGGWRNFPQFKNQGQCIAFVNHGP